jgi:hypothetical protein
MIAQRLWQHTRLNGGPIQQHIDPLLGTPSVHGVDDVAGDPSMGPQRSMTISQKDASS